MRVALFVPCFVDQLAPAAAIAALEVLERLGLEVEVPDGAPCCGQPPANAGFATAGEPALRAFVETFATGRHVVVLSGSCALHVRAHAGALGADGRRVAERTMEFCAFLHDVVGLERVAALNVALEARVALHIGCHALRGLGLATPTERMLPAHNVVRSLLETVRGLSFATLDRADECCGFGGSFSVGEEAVSTRMGRDRWRDVREAGASALISTDVSCLMHLRGIDRGDRGDGGAMPVWHVAEVLAGRAALVASTPAEVAARDVSRATDSPGGA
ncbi:MAG: (Fe-S)-binding protein [Gemmatimonadota bacterium]